MPTKPSGRRTAPRVKRRRRRLVETSDYAEMMERMVRSYGRRVASGDPADLAELLALARLLDQITADAVHDMIDRHGITWSEIGAAAGITKQGAFRRWSRRPCGARSTMAQGVTCVLPHGHDGEHLFDIVEGAA